MPRLPELRTGPQGARRHGDFAVALALAFAMTRARPAEYAYRPVLPDPGAGPHRLLDRPPEDLPAADPWAPLAGARLRAV